ncbi:hypothetical protein [Halorussus sp. MSC15.2]|uniref:hypothetical protein n=1 Tax=Halorussus sp. MSC15.2 TaxID=2283638 RepID=UPI0013D88735|nr:hypothetical protein [Halorussus sp. MSC15.2]
MIAGLQPLEVVGLVVSLVGLIPVVLQYRAESKWFTWGYILLVVGMVATNLENIVLAGFLDIVEHVVGVGAAGVVFLAAACLRRKQVIEAEET